MTYIQNTLSFPDRSKGYTCRCCGLFVKEYRRKINSSMCAVLCLLCRSGKRDFTHVENWLKGIGKSSLRADYHKLRFWGLIEAKKEQRNDSSNRNGYYKLTGLGIMFCELKLKVKEVCVIFDNECQGFEGEEIDIVEALGNKFSYAELMSI